MGRYRGRYRGGSSSMNMLNLVVMMLALGGLLYAGERIASVMSTAFTEVTDAPDEEDDSDQAAADTPLERGLDVVRSRVHFARNLALREVGRESAATDAEPSDGRPSTPAAEPSDGRPSTPAAEPSDGRPSTPAAEPSDGQDAAPEDPLPSSPLHDPSGDVVP